MIGHNNPPREITWKSISINKYDMELLEQVRQHIQKQRNLFGDNEKKVTIPMAINIMATSYWLNQIVREELIK